MDNNALDTSLDTFIFDLDGTLLDTIPDLALLTNRILREVGVPEHTTEEILSYVGSGVRRLIYLALPPESPQELQDQAMQLWNEHYHEYYEHTAPYDGIKQMLHDLRERGCKLAVVSNKLQGGVDVIMEKHLPGQFEVLFGEGPGIPRKPDPTGILKAVDLLGSTPANTLYVGDSPGDVRAGRNAGCETAAVLWGYHKKQDFIDEDAIPDYFIEHPSQIAALANNR